MRHSSKANVLSSFDILSEVIKLVSAVIVAASAGAVAIFFHVSHSIVYNASVHRAILTIFLY